MAHSRALLGLSMVCLLAACGSGHASEADRLGVTHVAGKYNFTDQDYLNEGADALAALGTRTIKVWAQHWQMQESYPFNSAWPEVSSLRELLQLPYMQALFDKAFGTYVLEAFEAPNTYFIDGVDAAEYARVEGQFCDATRYLLETYQGTGKRFIFQNWESDWAVRGHWDPGVDPTPEALAGLTAWLNARQDGVNRARREFTGSGVEVYQAAEVNLVLRAMEGHPSVTNDVLPNTACDLYSYSAWDGLASVADLTAAIEYIRSKAPDSTAFGDNNVYLGEVGYAETWGGPEATLSVMQAVVGVAQQLDLPYAIYWQLYCNEPLQPLDPGQRPTDTDMQGFWLIRPDGTTPPVWDYLAGLYARDPNVWLAISAAPRDGGIVSGGGRYVAGAVATISATPAAGWAFVGWEGPAADPGSPTTTVIMGDDKRIAAQFVPKHTLDVVGEGGSITVGSEVHTLPWSGEFVNGETVALQAVAEQYRRFDGWSGDIESDANPLQLVMDRSWSLTAYFSSIEIFADVERDFWAARAIAACVHAGIVQGYQDNTYRPSLAVTRDQMAVYTARALAGDDASVPSGPEAPTFGDVLPDHWAYRHVEYCVDADIVQGYPDGTYHPDGQVDRGQMAVYIARAMVSPTGDAAIPDLPAGDPTFPDVTATGDWAWCHKHVEYCAAQGVVQGYSDGTYHPAAIVTRDQMAVYIQRAFGLAS